MKPRAVVFSLIFLLIATAGWAAPRHYWQQDVAYEIHVTLNTQKNTLVGKERLFYKNNSPQTLQFIWFHTYPNAYKDNTTIFAKEMAAKGKSRFYFSKPADRGFTTWKRVTVNGTPVKWIYKPGDITETKVMLPKPLKPGESINFEIEFFVKIPLIFSRLGHEGRHYEMTQWYPKVVVYDDKGWHPDGYHATGEFYGEFGTFDVWVTLPKDMVIAATGNLVEPNSEIAFRDSLIREGEKIEQMKKKERQKYLKDRAKRIKAHETNDTKTVHFHAEKVHDFAWFADARFIVKKGTYKNTNIYVYVLPKHERAWKDAVEYVHDTLHYYGGWYGEYPYKQMSVVDGDLSAGGGMEYPNITVISSISIPFMRVLEMVIMHETGHQWFYGMLGSNEMDEAWMDEGINTFSEIRYLEKKYGRQGNMTKYPHWLSFLPPMGDRWTAYSSYFAYAYHNMDEPILQPAYKFRESYASMVYHKTAWMMFELKQLLGDDLFNRVMQTYFKEWQYKHPHTEDFVEVVNRVTGKDYTDYFNEWLRTTKKFDYALGKIGQEKTGNGYRITAQVKRRAEGIVPVDVQVTTKSGETRVKRIDGKPKLSEVTFQTRGKVERVAIDPGHNLLEINHWNDQKPAGLQASFLANLPNFYRKQVFYGPYVWYNSEKDGVQAGAWIHYGVPVVNQPTINLNVYYGLRSKRINRSANVTQDLPFFHRRSKLSLEALNVMGYVRNRMEMSFTTGHYLKRPPTQSVKMGLNVNNVYDLDYVNLQDWSHGKEAQAYAAYAFKMKTIRWQSDYKVSIEKGFKGNFGNFDYWRSSLEVNQTIRMTKSFDTHLRVFAGYVSGSVPLQRRFYLAGDLDVDRSNFFVLDRRGRFSPLEGYYLPGQGNLRGYYGQFTRGIHPAGNVISAINLDFPLPLLPFRFFYDLGNVWMSTSAVDFGNLRADAGLLLDLKVIQLVFPFWVSQPPAGEKNFAFRWIFGLSVPSSLSVGL